MICPEFVRLEVATLAQGGLAVECVEAGGQCYALARGLEAPSPPWDRAAYDILVAIPAAYEHGAALDAFYLGLPYTFHGGSHPRVENGAIITVAGRQWRLVSWHYPDGRPWQRGRGDDLGSHIVHCKGFFHHRGAVNGY